MSMDYVRTRYSVPAKRGGRVEYLASDGDLLQGTITGTCGARLRVRLDGAKRTGLFHPTWRLVYLTPNIDDLRRRGPLTLALETHLLLPEREHAEFLASRHLPPTPAGRPYDQGH